MNQSRFIKKTSLGFIGSAFILFGLFQIQGSSADPALVKDEASPSLPKKKLSSSDPGGYIPDEKVTTFNPKTGIQVLLGGELRQITSDPGNQTNPKISANRIVWVDDRNGGLYDIYLYDLTTNTERLITTDNAIVHHLSPDISGDRIVWQDERSGSWDVYLYDLATNTERQITMDPAYQGVQAISGNRIVWMDNRNGNWDIYLYDLSTNTEQRITSDPARQDEPAISGDRIVWRGIYCLEGFCHYAIYLYDLSTNTQRSIIADARNHIQPAISGDRIVWADDRNGNWDIYLYDLSTNTERRITTNIAEQRYPAISGDRIVWRDYRNNNWDIYLYDLRTNREQQITTDPAYQGAPAISGDRIVWSDLRNGNWDIYLSTINPNQAPVLAPIGEKIITEGNELRFAVSATDPDGDLLTYFAPDLPQGAAFDPNTQTFSWTPDFNQAGIYSASFSVSDGDLSDSETVIITVENVNRPPTFNPIGNKETKEGESLSFTVSAQDPDQDPIAYSATGLPIGASFNPSTRTFSWSPAYDQAGSYTVIFQASDGSASTLEPVTITVADNANVPPLPDLAMTWVSGPSRAYVGQTIAIYTTFQNQGPVTAWSGVYTALYLSQDQTIRQEDTYLGTRFLWISLGTGRNRTFYTLVKIPNVPRGTYYLGAFVDSTNRFKESREENNFLAGNSITIQ